MAPYSSKQFLLLAAVLTGVFVVPLSVAGVAVALPAIADDLGANPIGQQWALNGFNVSFAASTLAWGSLADRIGRWRGFQAGALIFIVASLVSFLAPNYVIIDAARLIAGLGAGAIFSVGSALLSVVFDGPQRARTFSFMGAVAGLSLAFGPTLCGLVTQQLNWHYIFAIQGLLLIVATLLLIPGRHLTHAEPRAVASFDHPGALLFFATTASLVCTLVFASAWALGVGAACLVALILRERRAQTPLLDLKLVTKLRFLGVSLVVAVASFTFAAQVTYIPSLLQATRRLSPATAGLFDMFLTAPTLVAPLAAWALVAGGRTPRWVLTVALGLMVAGGAGVPLASGAPLPVLAALMVLLGVGFGLHAGLVDNEALATAPAHHAGLAAGWVNTLRVSTEALAVSLFGTVFVPSLTNGNPASSFTTIGLVSTAIALAIAVVSAVAMHRRDASR